MNRDNVFFLPHGGVDSCFKAFSKNQAQWFDDGSIADLNH